jgi:hypothetical protein
VINMILVIRMWNNIVNSAILLNMFECAVSYFATPILQMQY